MANQHSKSKLSSSAPESAQPTNSMLCPPPETRHTSTACAHCRSSHRPHRRRPEAPSGAPMTRSGCAAGGPKALAADSRRRHTIGRTSTDANRSAAPSMTPNANETNVKCSRRTACDRRSFGLSFELPISRWQWLGTRSS